jgi:hypothetical protein
MSSLVLVAARRAGMHRAIRVAGWLSVGFIGSLLTAWSLPMIEWMSRPIPFEPGRCWSAPMLTPRWRSALGDATVDAGCLRIDWFGVTRIGCDGEREDGTRVIVARLASGWPLRMVAANERDEFAPGGILLHGSFPTMDACGRISPAHVNLAIEPLPVGIVVDSILFAIVIRLACPWLAWPVRRYKAI